MTDTTDLDALIVMARDTVQHYAGALVALDDSDLMELPGSPSTEPHVSGTSTPAAPYNGDGGLRRRVMSAAADLHAAACELLHCSLDDEVGAYERPPVPNLTGMLDLEVILTHTRELDAAYARLQVARAHDDTTAIVASTSWVLDSHTLCATVEGPDGDRVLIEPPAVAGIWRSLGGVTSPTCHLCGKLDSRRVRDGDRLTTAPTPVHGRVCASCRAEARQDGDAADGREDRCRLYGSRQQCRGHIEHPRLGLCRSCAQAERDARRGKTSDPSGTAPVIAHVQPCPECSATVVVSPQGGVCPSCAAEVVTA